MPLLWEITQGVLQGQGMKDLIDQLVLRVRAETEKQETQKAVESPVDFAKGLVSRGLPAEQIKNIIMKKYGKPEQAALGIMRGAGIE